MKIGLVIPIYNRAGYVKECFDSLLALATKPDVIVLVDDASTDEMIKVILFDFRSALEIKKINYELITHTANLGVRSAVMHGSEYLFANNCDLVINLDSDAIVKPNFITELLRAYKVGKENNICSGFNCISKDNPLLPYVDNDNVKYKAFCNGINMCFNKKQYEKYIKPSLAKDGNWDYNTSLACQADNMPFVITSPSVVQHIGMVSSMGHHHQAADRAQDFKMIQLPDVTLFGIDSHDIPGITKAAEICQRDIDFGAVNIITDDLFTKNGSNETRRNDYSRFMLKELTKHFDTSHVLTIHADGYVLNWKAWDDEFLKYDYIGATWLYKDNKNVGNGGFSLRSKKLCSILADNFIEPELMHPEDHCICRLYRKSLEDKFGIKFAPEEVANRFGIEAYGAVAIKDANRYSGQFGFHGVHVDFSDSGLPKDILYPASKIQPEVITRRVNPLHTQTRVDRVRDHIQNQKR